MITDEKIIELISPDRDAAVSLQTTLASQRANYYKWYRGQAYGNERTGWSQTVHPAIYNHLQGDLPSFLEIFEQDFFSFKATDEKKALNMEKLVRAQMFRLQDGYKRFFDFLYDAELYHYSVFKVYKKDEIDLVGETLPEVTEEQMMQLANDPSIMITKVTEERAERVVDAAGQEVSPELLRYKDVKIVRKVQKFSGPALEVVPPWEFFYSPDCKIGDFGEINGKLVMHRVRRSLDYIAKKEKAGLYKKGSVDLVKDKASDVLPITSEDQTVVETEVDEVPQFPGSTLSTNELEKEVIVDEVYFRADIDDDGLLEHVYAHVVDNVILLLEENPYGRPCFRVGSISPEPHKLLGIPMPELLDYDQRVMTNLIRLIQDSAAQSVYRNPVTNDAQMFKLLQNRRPFAVIKGDPTKLGEVKVDSPNQFILRAWEMLKGENEEKTGRTRYNQGLDSNSLNKTATGISIISAASAKRIRMVAKLLGNGVFMGVLSDFIFINQQWPPAETNRLLGVEYTVNPDDLAGKFEIEVDIGVGPAEKQALANQVDLFIQWQLKAGIQLGLVTPIHVQRAMTYKYQLLGIKVDGFMKTEDEFIREQQIKAQQAQMQQAIQARVAAMGGMSGQAIPGGPGVPGIQQGPGGPGGPGPGRTAPLARQSGPNPAAVGNAGPVLGGLPPNPTGGS